MNKIKIHKNPILYFVFFLFIYLVVRFFISDNLKLREGLIKKAYRRVKKTTNREIATVKKVSAPVTKQVAKTAAPVASEVAKTAEEIKKQAEKALETLRIDKAIANFFNSIQYLMKQINKVSSSISNFTI